MHSVGNEEALEGIRSWVQRTLGLQFDSERRPMFEQRLAALCRRLAASMPQLHARLESGDGELALLVAEEVSTNHTYFLREPEMFDFLGETVLPSLSAVTDIRMWSAAASSGEEAYSLAMCSARALGGPEARERVSILGTDISERQIRHAERGVFHRRNMVHLTPELMSSFEDGGDSTVRVRHDIASMCVFRRLNLTQFPWPFQRRFHVVFLRNVLYYFSAATRREVLEACFDATEPGGWLITSLTEPMIDTRSSWVQWQPGVFRKPGGSWQ